MMRNIAQKETVPLETLFNVFTRSMVRTSIPKDEKPPEWTVEITDHELIKKVTFIPVYYILPSEVVIQRVILGHIKDLFDCFEGTQEEFENHEFEIRTADISSHFDKKFENKEIRKAFEKLGAFRTKVQGVENGKKVGFMDGLIREAKHHHDTDRYTFKPAPIFQLIRKEELRDQNIQRLIGMKYDKVHIDIKQILNYPKYEQLFLHFLVTEYEASHQKLKSRNYRLTTDFYAQIFNTKRIDHNQKTRLNNAIKSLNAREEFKGRFQIKNGFLKVIYE